MKFLQAQITPNVKGHIGNIQSAVTLTNSGLQDVASEIIVAGSERLFAFLSNTTQALNAFAIQGKADKGGTFVTMASAALDFSTPSLPILKTVGTPVSLAAGTTAWFLMDTTGLYSIRIQATAAVTGALLTLEWGRT